MLALVASASTSLLTPILGSARAAAPDYSTIVNNKAVISLSVNADLPQPRRSETAVRQMYAQCGSALNTRRLHAAHGDKLSVCVCLQEGRNELGTRLRGYRCDSARIQRHVHR